MKVLFLMFAFPDMNESFNMYTALVDMFHKNGHSVTVVAPGTHLKKSTITKEKDIEILRIKTLAIKNVSNIRKGIGNLLIPYQYKKSIRKFYRDRKFDLIIIPTPPITLGTLASALKKKHNAKVYLILRDIFPQNAVDLGFMRKGGTLHKFFKKKENFLYNTADFIGCMSQANIEFLKKNSEVPDYKLHVLRNWQYLNTDEYTDVNTIREKYDLLNKFVVVFGGNMGKPQQLENVIELAKRCKEYPDVLFLLLGEGVAMKKLAIKIYEEKITNIRIQSTISKIEYQRLISVCNIGLISLHESFTIPNIPSKTLDYFNIGLPVLASIDKATDFGKILEEAGAGLWSYAGDHEGFKNNFDKIYFNKDERELMGRNARNYFQNYLTPDIAYSTILSKISIN